MRKLRGTDPGDVLMRNMIRGNPELLRNVIGQEFSDNPAALHNAGNLEAEYTSQMPELQQLLGQHRNHQQALEHANEALQQSQAEHAAIVANEQKAFRLAENERLASEKAASKKEALQDKVELLDRHIEELTKASKRKDVSLEQHMKDKQALDKAKKERINARAALTALVAPYPGYKLGKFLFGGNNQQGES